MDKKQILEKLGVSLFLRDGKYYWMIKSDSFETMDTAYADAVKTFSENNGIRNA